MRDAFLKEVSDRLRTTLELAPWRDLPSAWPIDVRHDASVTDALAVPMDELMSNPWQRERAMQLAVNALALVARIDALRASEAASNEEGEP